MLACTRDHDWDAPPRGVEDLISPELDVTRLLCDARRHGVEACVHLSLRDVAALGSPERESLEEAYFTALHWHVRAGHDLSLAASAFDRVGVPWLTFKGPVLAEAIYRRSDLRSYADLDLLVAPDRLRDAIGALEAVGGELLDRNWHLALTRMHGEVHIRLPTGTTADLHWHIVNEPTLRGAFTVSTDDLLRRTRTVEIEGRPIRTLTMEDTLVHLAVHACTSGGNRLLWCKDLEQAARQEGLDWDAVVARARSWGAGPPVAVMLTVASRALSFDVAPEVLRALSPGPVWRRLARITDRLSPVERWDGGGSLLRQVCRSTRGGDRASARAMALRVASLATSRGRSGPHQPDRDPTSPHSILFPAGGRGGQEAFLAAVEQSTAGRPSSRSE